MEINRRQNVVIASPRTFEQRGEVANACLRDLHIELPAVLDNFQNSTERAYSAWPDRLYVIDRDGRIAYKSKPGPFGFLPQEVADSLDNLVVPAPEVALR